MHSCNINTPFIDDLGPAWTDLAPYLPAYGVFVALCLFFLFISPVGVGLAISSSVSFPFIPTDRLG